MKTRSKISCWALIFITAVQYAWGGPTSEVTTFAPEGDVKDVRQVRASFSEAITALGDIQGDVDPFQISCPVPGKGHWADPKNWVYDFEKDVPAGLHCRFSLNPNLKTSSGGSIQGRTVFEFDTGGPNIKSSEPWDGQGAIDEEQIFVLTLDAEAEPNSVLSHAYFSVDGIQDKIPVQLLPKDPREAEPKKEQTVIQAKLRFPPEAKIQLIWGKGIAAPGGGVTRRDQVLSFQVRPEFKAEFNCQRENADAPCSPLSDMWVRFHTYVPLKDAKKVRLRFSNGKDYFPHDLSNKEDSDVQQVLFKGPFPENSKIEVILPAGLKDDAGRPVANADRFPLEVATAEYPPLLKFPASFGILESNPEAILPVTVRNIEAPLSGSKVQISGNALKLGAENFSEMIAALVSLGRSESGASVFTQSEKLRSEKISIHRELGDKAFEVLGIPLKTPGFYRVELESQRLGQALLGKNAPFYVTTAALVTNLSVHFKRGRQSSLVWVTTLDQGLPVSNAKVTVRNCQGEILASAVTQSDGTARINQELPASLEKNCARDEDGYSQFARGLFITAEKGDQPGSAGSGDFSFVHSSWNRGIEPWRYGALGGYDLTPEYATTVFDRPLFRAGETVHMKHFFRRHSMEGIEAVALSNLPNFIRIRHQESNQTYEFPLQWRKGGAAESIWNIPAGSKLGVYTVSLVKKGDDRQEKSWEAGSFRVEEYRIPLMRAQIKPPAEALVNPKEIPIDFSVEYLSGGGAGNLPVQVRAQLVQEGSVQFPGLEDFEFQTGEFEAESSKEQAVFKQAFQLDRLGTGHFVIPNFGKPSTAVQSFRIELDYRDPNGEAQTVSQSLKVYPSERLIGFKLSGRGQKQEAYRFDVVVTDLKGHPVPNAPVEVELLGVEHYSHRKRLVGGFYSYDNKYEVNRHGKVCSGRTAENGVLECKASLKISGQVQLEARAQDDAGRTSVSHLSDWVYGEKENWFSQEDSDRIDLVPSEKKYEVGQKASIEVRMPFREATALVTVEREGVIDSFVTRISGKNPVIELPILPKYSPNVFVSVLVVRGRVGDVQPTALVDLGRPAYKLGLKEIQVGWKPYELSVQVQPSKDVFQVREDGKVKIKVATPLGAPPPADAEVALAIVDEGLLQLKDNESWNLLKSMMQLRGEEVETSTAQSEVIGKRHFGLKALPLGGDGGRSPTRQILNSLLYWNANVPLDSNGEAEIQVPMNDAITGFRVAAVAHAGVNLFGTGYAKFRTTQDLMILPGIPPLAREGDQLNLEFTVRNTTQSPMDLSISAQAPGVQDLQAHHFQLPPNEAQVVRWPVRIPNGISNLKYLVSARNQAGSQTDRIEITQKVLPAVPERVIQSTLVRLKGVYEAPIESPPGNLPGRGGVDLLLNSSIAGGLEGVRAYMRDYPFSCLEQKVSRAISLRDKKFWKTLVDEMPNSLDSDGLLKFFPSNWLQGSDVLTAYVISLSEEAGWNLPETIRNRLIQGLKAFVQGKLLRGGELPSSDLTIRKLSALGAISRYGEANWAMTGSLKIEPQLWPTSAVLDWKEILERVKDVPDVENRRKEVDQILRSRLNFSGSQLSFANEDRAALWWMMSSGSTDANRLLLSVLKDPSWKPDLGRLARGVLLRQREGHWDTTTANAWGVLAIEQFVRDFEKDPIQGFTTVSIDGEEKDSIFWKPGQTEKRKEFPWPDRKTLLSVEQDGTGAPWLTLQGRAAIPVKEPLFYGYRVKKEWIPVEQKVPGKWSKGDIAKIHLDLEAQSEMTWVVVNDPIPAGAAVLGSGLGNDSGISVAGEKSKGWVELSFQERAFDGLRAYYQYVPKGQWSFEYTVRLNQSGEMNLPNTRIEAMYAPELFGELPNASILVAE